MKKYYSLCGKNILIDVPYLPGENRLADIFERDECTPDISFLCEKRDVMPAFGDSGKAYMKDGTVYRRNHVCGNYETHAAYSDNGICRVDIPSDGYDHFTDDRYLWFSLSFAQVMLHYGVLNLHASNIAYKGKSVLFSAPSRTGKSTQAALWEKYRGAKIINGDKAALAVGRDGVTAHGVPGCGTSGICHNVSLPAGAVVILSQGKDNTVRRLGIAEAMSALCSNVYADMTLPEEKKLVTELLISVVSSVPVYGFECTPDERAVDVLERALVEGGVFPDE